jgi:hypothetical protein
MEDGEPNCEAVGWNGPEFILSFSAGNDEN